MSRSLQIQTIRESNLNLLTGHQWIIINYFLFNFTLLNFYNYLIIGYLQEEVLRL